MRLVPCEPTGSRCSPSGFTPGSLPIPGPTLSPFHSITLVQEEWRIASTQTSFTVSRHLTPSHSIPIATDRSFQARIPQESVTRNVMYALRGVCET
jgi:hypothetical protein